ncbi:MAG: hypothetical protein IPH88_15590 [Bacteroidales bacterium]|nr:hypothetical protein [Bacteroidales bacterium]
MSILFLQFIFNVWQDNDFIFNFRWLGLSAGEAALLNLFSRVHAVAGYKKFNETIWLIDEGTCIYTLNGKEILYQTYIISFPEFFKVRKMQLFLHHTHLFWFLISQRENIILLDKDENGWGKVLDKESWKYFMG